MGWLLVEGCVVVGEREGSGGARQNGSIEAGKDRTHLSMVRAQFIANDAKPSTTLIHICSPAE